MSMRNNQTNRLQNSCTNAKFGRRFGNDSQTVAAIAARRRVRASRGITIAVAPVRRASVGRPSLERLPCVFRGPRGITDPPPSVARASANRPSSVCHAFAAGRAASLTPPIRGASVGRPSLERLPCVCHAFAAGRARGL